MLAQYQMQTHGWAIVTRIAAVAACECWFVCFGKAISHSSRRKSSRPPHANQPTLIRSNGCSRTAVLSPAPAPAIRCSTGAIAHGSCYTSQTFANQALWVGLRVSTNDTLDNYRCRVWWDQVTVGELDGARVYDGCVRRLKRMDADQKQFSRMRLQTT